MEMTAMAPMDKTDRMAFEGAEDFACGGAPLIGHLGDSFYLVVANERIEFGPHDGDFTYVREHNLARGDAARLGMAILHAFAADRPMGEVAAEFQMCDA